MKKIILFILLLTSSAAQAKIGLKLQSVSTLFFAYAPNAGGQQTIAFKATFPNYEATLFQNNALLAGDSPIVGAYVERRFSTCLFGCLFKSHLGLGAGASSGGGFFTITGSFTTAWVARVDISTHLFPSENRIIQWSYPLWLGFSIPLSI